MEEWHIEHYADKKRQIVLLTNSIRELEYYHSICNESWFGKIFEHDKYCLEKQALKIEMKKLKLKLLEIELLDIEHILCSY
jgi:hypothetical protein